jgi:flagellar basal body rod protein FlgG
MMTQKLEVSILAAPLASIDRRALSQAWYSALRFAPNTLPLPAVAKHHNVVAWPRPASARYAAEPSRPPAPQRYRAAAMPSKSGASRSGKEENDVRRVRVRPALEQRIERVFFNARSAPRRATFSLGRGAARIHVILQTNGRRTTLLALCRPEMRPLVAEALSRARIALAARNIGVEMRDRIAERAADVRRAYTPGAIARHDDVATPATLADFTFDPLSVALPDATYFVTSDDQGMRTYTRNGSLRLREGTLSDADGKPILGVRTSNAALAPLSVDAVDEALGRVRDAAIERDGTLVYHRETIDPRSGNRDSQRVVVGRTALARFPAGTRLDPNDGSHSTAPPGVTPQLGLPGSDGFAALLPMHRERSRIDVDESLVRLKEAYLAFDALQAAEAAKGHLGKTAMDLLK